MIALMILATLAVIAIAAAMYDVFHDGYGRVRTDWNRVAERCEGELTRARRARTARVDVPAEATRMAVTAGTLPR